jgi:hypothetical protein
MAANILRGDRAIHMSVFVVWAFVRLREHLASNQAILKRLAEIDRTLLEHDSALVDLYEKLQPLLQPLPAEPKRRIGFEGPGPWLTNGAPSRCGYDAMHRASCSGRVVVSPHLSDYRNGAAVSRGYSCLMRRHVQTSVRIRSSQGGRGHED